MARFYFDIYNSFVSIDDEGIDLADTLAAREQVRITLPALLRDLKAGQDTAQMRVDVRNEAGKRVVSGTILLVIESTKEQDASDTAAGRPTSTPDLS